MSKYHTTIINLSYKTVGRGKVDIQTLKDTSPLDIKINWHKYHKSYIQSHLCETEGQTNLYFGHSIMTEAVPHGLLRLRCIYYNCTYSWIFYWDPVEYYWNGGCTYARSSIILLSLDINALKKLLILFSRLTRMCDDPTTKGNKYLWVLCGKLNMCLIAFCHATRHLCIEGSK